MADEVGSLAADPALGVEVCQAIRRQIEKLGLDLGDEPVWAEARFAMQFDPGAGESCLVGSWRGKSRDGTLTFFPDGRVFAEYQVLLPHPKLPGHYVEAVQVWGRAGALKGDPVIAAFAA